MRIDLKPRLLVPICVLCTATLLLLLNVGGIDPANWAQLDPARYVKNTSGSGLLFVTATRVVSGMLGDAVQAASLLNALFISLVVTALAIRPGAGTGRVSIAAAILVVSNLAVLYAGSTTSDWALPILLGAIIVRLDGRSEKLMLLGLLVGLSPLVATSAFVVLLPYAVYSLYLAGRTERLSFLGGLAIGLIAVGITTILFAGTSGAMRFWGITFDAILPRPNIALGLIMTAVLCNYLLLGLSGKRVSGLEYIPLTGLLLAILWTPEVRLLLVGIPVLAHGLSQKQFARPVAVLPAAACSACFFLLMPAPRLDSAVFFSPSQSQLTATQAATSRWLGELPLLSVPRERNRLQAAAIELVGRSESNALVVIDALLGNAITPEILHYYFPQRAFTTYTGLSRIRVKIAGGADTSMIHAVLRWPSLGLLTTARQAKQYLGDSANKDNASEGSVSEDAVTREEDLRLVSVQPEQRKQLADKLLEYYYRSIH